jgi:hypothetical protein
MNWKTAAIRSSVIALLVSFSAFRGARAADEDAAKLLKALPASKYTLADGIQQASAKSPEVAISAKFELEDGKLSLSVYTVAKGLAVDAEHNTLKELAGSPEAAKWNPETEIFKDVPHVSRASQQLSLMALSKFSLLDIIKKVEKDQPGVVFSITPVLRNQKAEFSVLVAVDGKAVDLHYDLFSGDLLKK